MANKKGFKTPTEAFISVPDDAPKSAESNTAVFAVPAGYRLIKESKNKRLQLLVTPTINDSLRAAAAVEGISLNELCNRIFEEYFKRG